MSVVYSNRTEHPDFGELPMRSPFPGLAEPERPSADGQCEVYELGGKWFFYRVTSGGAHRSIGYASREAAEEELSQEIAGTYEFWREKIAWRKAGDRTSAGRPVIRCNGMHYVVGTGSAGSLSAGFGGHEFRFRMLKSGQVVTTRDLWFQGEIPVEFRDELPDNAEIAPEVE